MNLTSFVAKYNRSVHHFQEVNGAIDDWAKANGGDIELRPPHGPSESYEASLRIHVVPDVEYWSVVLGDAIHNLRASLDHLAYGLAHADGARPTEAHAKRLAFPVVDDASQWDDAVERSLPGVATKRADEIKSWQPFVTHSALPAAAPLSLLAYLDNVDKHRWLRVVATHPEKYEWRTAADASGDAHFSIAKQTPLEDGAHLFRVTFTAGPRALGDLVLSMGVGIQTRGEAVMASNTLETTLTSAVKDIIENYLGPAPSPAVGP